MLLQSVDQLLAEEATRACAFSQRMLHTLQLCEGQYTPMLEPDPMNLDWFPAASPSGTISHISIAHLHANVSFQITRVSSQAHL